jgi:hypothetical protein
MWPDVWDTYRMKEWLEHPDGRLKTLEELEEEAIRNAIEKFESRTEAAHALGMGRSSLYKRMKDLKITEPRHQKVRELVNSMKDDDVRTIQWVVEIQTGRTLRLSQIRRLFD